MKEALEASLREEPVAHDQFEGCNEMRMLAKAWRGWLLFDEITAHGFYCGRTLPDAR